MTISSILLAAITLPGLFSNYMVLQRGKPVSVWGKAEPGETVTVSFNGATATGVADAKGRWVATLPAQEILKEGREMKVSGSVTKDARVFKDVLVGDVWLISGQSNAEMTFNWGIINGKEEMAAATNTTAIRAVKVSHATALLPVTEQVPCGTWSVCGPKTLGSVTAMGYFFARELQAKTDIPMGILDCNWSGCCIEPFMATEGLKLVPEAADLYKRQMDKLAEIRGSYAARLAALPADGIPTSDEIVKDPWFPFGMQYHAMVAPLVRFPIAGATWYQGCSNGSEGPEYLVKLRALAAGWRANWGYEFPFYVVQLSSFTGKTTDPAGGNGYARIREAQRGAVKAIPQSGLAVTIDIGNPSDIHPKNKQDVGHRLALWARRDVYGEKDLVVSGPLFAGCTAEDGALRVRFDSVGSGLMAGERGPNEPGALPTATPDGKLRGFAVAGADKKWFWADAKIDGETVVVSSKDVPSPVAVRYAFRANPMGDCNLYNKEGLPASPFRSDDW